jgi:hypothetical protein
MTKRVGTGSGSVNQEYISKDPDPYPYQNVTDPEHWLECFQSYSSYSSLNLY